MSRTVQLDGREILFLYVIVQEDDPTWEGAMEAFGELLDKTGLDALFSRVSNASHIYTRLKRAGFVTTEGSRLTQEGRDFIERLTENGYFGKEQNFPVVAEMYEPREVPAVVKG